MDKPANSERPQRDNQAQPATAGRNRLQSARLFRDTREVIIEHAGEEYSLRLTNQGKLILTK